MTMLMGLGALLLVLLQAPAQVMAADVFQENQSGVRWFEHVELGGHLRFDYYSVSKRLDDTHSLPGLTIQPTALKKLAYWGDAKVEGRLRHDTLRGGGLPQGQLIEAYTNLYFGSVDLRVGKQIIQWGRADGINPTDNLTPKDFTLLSAKDEEERRTGTAAIRLNAYRGTHTVSLIWLPVLNPTTVPLSAQPGFRFSEEKRDHGEWTNQGIAFKWDQTGGAIDWSLSYYNGRDVLPVGRPISLREVVLTHTRQQAFGADMATTLGRYGFRAEAAYVYTQDPHGTDDIIKNPYVFYILGIDRELTEDFNVNAQYFQRVVFNFKDPFAIREPVLRQAAVLSAIVNQQHDPITNGVSIRIKSTWWNKTMESELLGVVNTNRGDVFFRPLLTYAFTDVWKGFVGADIFNGRRDSFFGFFQNMTAFFVEFRATF